MTTSSPKLTPRVEALNHLLNWVEEMEERYYDGPDITESAEIEDRVACFVTFAVGNAAAAKYKDLGNTLLFEVIANTKQILEEVFDELKISDDALYVELFQSSVAATVATILSLPTDHKPATTEERERILDFLSGYMSLRIKNLVNT